MHLLTQNTTRLDETILKDTIATLAPYAHHLRTVVENGGYSELECSINLPSDESILNNVRELVAQKVTQELKYVIVIGIGGSNLGTKAIYDAIQGFYDNLFVGSHPQLLFLDTQDSDVLHHVQKFFTTIKNPQEILINAISKSGGTTETAANLEVVYESLKSSFGEDIKQRFVFTTDDGSKMYEVAKKHGISALTIPKLVGGRYSVLSAVGLFPLMAAGFDVVKLLNGACSMRETCIGAVSENNPSALSAAILYLHNKTGVNINDTFIFVPALESLGKWYRQLMGESIGKDGKGITPTVSIGSTDLHSVGQLYLGGPKDKITTFIYQRDPMATVVVPPQTEFDLVDTILGKKIQTIMDAIVGGTKKAYDNQKLPYMEIIFEKIDEESLGVFLQFKMMEMMYLGRLMDVTTFDQPHVELYKTETKRILQDR